MRRRGHGHLRRPFSSTPTPLSLLSLFFLFPFHKRTFESRKFFPSPKTKKIKNKSISDPKKIVAAKSEEPHKGSDLEKTLKIFAKSFFLSSEEEEEDEEEEERLLVHTRVAETLKRPRRQGWRIQVAKSSMRQIADDKVLRG
jgi:hypothetical protein